MAAPTFFIFSRLDYYNTIVLYSVFREYFNAQSPPNQLAEVGAVDRGMAVPRFFIFSRLDYYNTIVLYSVFREYSDAQSLPNQLAKVCAMARQRRDFLFSHGWIITIL